MPQHRVATHLKLLRGNPGPLDGSNRLWLSDITYVAAGSAYEQVGPERSVASEFEIGGRGRPYSH